MEAALTYRLMQPGEENGVHALLRRVFEEFVAPDFASEGVRQFMGFISAETLARRSREDHFILVAARNDLPDTFVGMIEIRGYQHVSLLFVDRRFHRKGIGTELLQRAVERCRLHNPDLTRLTVNSSPYAVRAYQQMGFQREGPEQTLHGIRFIPMVLRVTEAE